MDATKSHSHPHPHQHNPFEVTEILLAILSNLSTSELRAVNSVCQTWHQACRSLLLTATSWHPRTFDSLHEPDPQEWFRQRLAWTRTLDCAFASPNQPTRQQYQLMCFQLFDILEGLPVQEKDRIQGLVLQVSGPAMTTPLISFFGKTLTSLRSVSIKVGCFTSMPLRDLLDKMEQLEEVEVLFWVPSYKTYCQLQPNADDALIPSPFGPHFFSQYFPSMDQTRNPKRPYKLRKLAVQGATLSLPFLQQVLADCPALEELRLEATWRANAPNGEPASLRALKDTPFFAAVAKTCPHLCRLHFSESYSGLQPELMDLIWEAFPNLESFGSFSAYMDGLVYPSIGLRRRASPVGTSSFSGAFVSITSPSVEMSPQLQIMPGLVNKDTLLTTLELTSKKNRVESVRDFHAFLCISPHLIHVKAAPVLLNAKILDLSIPSASVVLSFHLPLNSSNTAVNENGPNYPFITSADGEKTEPKRIWACRGLKTLHISLELDNILKPRSDGGPALSRAVFAYLAVVCPKLEELYIQESDIRLQLESGLCLLSGLSKLRSLIIYTFSPYDMQARDCTWMGSSVANLNRQRFDNFGAVGGKDFIRDQNVGKDFDGSVRALEKAKEGGSWMQRLWIGVYELQRKWIKDKDVGDDHEPSNEPPWPKPILLGAASNGRHSTSASTRCFTRTPSNTPSNPANTASNPRPGCYNNVNSILEQDNKDDYEEVEEEIAVEEDPLDLSDEALSIQIRRLARWQSVLRTMEVLEARSQEKVFGPYYPSCWPLLERLWIRPGQNKRQTQNDLDMIYAVRPELRHQGYPHHLWRSCRPIKRWG